MKKFLIVLGALLCLVLLVTAVLEFALDLNVYKGQIESPLEASLRRNVAIGHITHTLWKGPGAALQDVTVFDREPSDVFVHIQEVIAKVKVLPLISKKIELSKILLQQPVVTLKRNLEGKWNIDDLLGVKAEAAPALPPETTDTPATAATPAIQASPQELPAAAQAPISSSSLSQFAIDTLRLTDGKIRVIDEMVNMTTELENVEVTVDGVAVDSPVQFRLSANVDGGSLGKIEAAGKVGPIPATGNFENLDLDITAKLDQVDVSYFRPYYVAQLANAAAPGAGKLSATIQLAGNVGTQVTSTGNVSVGDVKVDVAGNVAQVQTTPKLDLTISSQELPWKKLLELLPPDLTKKIEELGLSGIGNLIIQPKGTLDNLAVHGEFDLSQSGIRYQKVFAKPEATNMKLSFEIALNALNPDAVNVSALTLTMGEFVLKAAGTVTNFKQPELDLQVESNEFPLEQLFALFPQIAALTGADANKPALTAKGAGMLQASARGKLDDLAVQLTVNLDHSAVSYADFFQKSDQEAGNLHIEAQIGKDSVSIAQALLNVGKWQLTAAGTITNFKQPQLDMVIETNAFDISSLLAHSPITTTKYLPKELTLKGISTLRIAPVGSLDNLAISGKIDLTKSAVAFGEYFAKPQDLPGIIEFDATLTKDAVAIRKVQINLNGVILDVTGMVSGLRQQTMLDLSVTSNRFALNQLFPVKGMALNPTGDTQLTFILQSPVDRLNLASIAAAHLELTDVGFLPPQFTKPVEHLTACLDLQGQQLTIQQLSATLGASSFSGNARAAQIFTRPDVTFALDASTLNIDELLGVISQAFAPLPSPPFRFVASTQSSQAQQSAAAAVSPQKVWQFANITAAGVVAIAQGQAQNVHFSHLTAEVKAQNQIIQIEPLALHLYDGDYQGFVRVDLSEPDPQYALHSELVHVDSNQILTDGVSLEDIVYGFIFADASLQGQGVTTEQVLSTLSGSGLLKIEDGKFTTFNIWPQLAQIFQLLGSLGKSKELARIGKDLSEFPEETHFSRFEGRFEVKNGKAGSSDLSLQIPEQNIHLTLLLTGEFGLDTSLDFIGKVCFDPQSKYYQDIEKYFRDFKQADGSIELPFPVPIGGTLLKPEVNMKSIEKSLAKFVAEIGKQEAQKQLEKIGTDLLKGLLKKKK